VSLDERVEIIIASIHFALDPSVVGGVFRLARMFGNSSPRGRVQMFDQNLVRAIIRGEDPDWGSAKLGVILPFYAWSRLPTTWLTIHPRRGALSPGEKGAAAGSALPVEPLHEQTSALLQRIASVERGKLALREHHRKSKPPLSRHDANGLSS
jgi:hypothetical protein